MKTFHNNGCICLAVCTTVMLVTISVRTAGGADLFVGTEYRYPTRYDVVPIMGVNALGQQTIVGAIVTPTDFQTRMVGVQMSVEATIANLNAVNGVVAAMADAKSRGNTDLMIAASLGDADKVKTLIAGRALVNTQNQFGSTALMGAAAGGDTNIVRMLLDAGAAVNAKSKSGSTALMFAAKNGHKDVVSMLLAKSAAVNGSDDSGMTALMYAVYGGANDVVKVLLSKGAKIDAADRKGTTPAALASNQKKDDIVATFALLGASR